MRFRVFLLLWVLFLPAVTWGQGPCTLSVQGRVVSESGDPMINAAVKLESEERGAVADSTGHFMIDKLCPGEHVLEISFVGYETQYVRVKAGDKQIGVQMIPSQGNLQEVVVEEKIVEVDRTTNYVALEGEMLDKAAGKTLGESLKALPGVATIQTGPGIFKPVIHGVHSQRILILNHGIRQEGQQWGAEHAPEIDPFIASSIVVIKDAAAIRYGTDALGGVVIVNPAPLPERPGFGGSINTVLQSNGRSGTISGMLEGGLGKLDGWGWRVQATGRRGGDYHAADYSLTNTGVREFDFSSALGYHKGKFGAEVFFSHFQTELGILRGTAVSNLDDLIIATETEPPIGTTDFSYDINPPRQTVSHNLLKLKSHWTKAKGEWSFQYGYQSNFRREFDIRKGSDSAIPAIDLDLRTHTLEAEFETKERSGKQFCFGINGMCQDNTNIHGTKRIPFIPNYASISGGPYAVGKFTINKWSLDVGTRYDVRSYEVVGFDFSNTLYRSSLLFHNVSASAGLSRHLGQYQHVKLNLSSAWRPPHVAELYSLGTHQSAAAIEYGMLLNDSTNRVMDISEVPFKVEQALKLVASYAYHRGPLQLEASAYVNHIANFFYLQPRGVTTNVRGTFPYFRYTQTDVLFLGFDVQADYTISHAWSASVKASRLRVHDIRNDDYLVFIPANRIEASLRYQGPFHRFYLEPKVMVVDKQENAPRVITVRQFKDAIDNGQDPLGGSTKNFDFMEAPPGYVLAGLAAGYSWPIGSGRLDARLSVDNLFNASYRDYTNRLRYYADDVGRNVSFSLKYLF